MTPDAIPLEQLTIVDAPDVRDWPVTTTITSVEFRPDDVRVAFGKQEGADRWPDVTPPGWDGPIQWTLWAIVQVGAGWVTTGCIEFWHGRAGVGGPFSHAAKDWYYFVPAMAGVQPGPGDEVGFMAVAGDQRRKDVRSVHERSNIVLVTVPTHDGGILTFDDAPTPQPSPTPVTAPPLEPPHADALWDLAAQVTLMRGEIMAMRAELAHLQTRPFPTYRTAGGVLLKPDV